MGNEAFLSVMQLFVDGTKQEMDEVVRRTGIKILGRLVQMSPVGQPEIWKINQTATAYNAAVKEHNASLRNAPDNLTKAGRLRRGLKVHDSMGIKKPIGYVGGRFRSNWFVSFDVQSTETTEDIDASGATSNARGLAVIESFRVGQASSIYFSNNLPYAYRLEMGHSAQAPGGMVRVTASNAEALFREALNEVKSGI